MKALGNPKALLWRIPLAVIFFSLAAMLTYQLTRPIWWMSGAWVVRPLATSFVPPSVLVWRQDELVYRKATGFVGLWRHSDGSGTMSLHLIDKGGDGKLDVNLVRQRSLKQMSDMGYAIVAQGAQQERILLAKSNGDLAAFEFKELAHGVLRTSYVTGSIKRFDLYRRDWEAFLATIHAPTS